MQCKCTERKEGNEIIIIQDKTKENKTKKLTPSRVIKNYIDHYTLKTLSMEEWCGRKEER